MLALGRQKASFLEGAVGLALLITVGSVAIRLPGHEATFAVIGIVMVVASLVFLLMRDEQLLGPAVGMSIPVVAVSLLAASLPFIASGHIGIPGVGLNNDMASHLIYGEWLLDPDRL